MNDHDIMNMENGLAPIEENSSFLARLYGDDAWLTGGFSEMPYADDAFLLGTPVAGTSHVKNMPDLYEELEEGERLALIREPDNAYDNRAIRVETLAGDKLGYVPRFRNLILSRLMDAGYYLYARVRLLEIENGSYYHIVIKIYISISEYGTRNDELLRLGEEEEDLKSCRDYPDSDQ